RLGRLLAAVVIAAEPDEAEHRLDAVHHGIDDRADLIPRPGEDADHSVPDGGEELRDRLPIVDDHADQSDAWDPLDDVLERPFEGVDDVVPDAGEERLDRPP